ncbi:MAG: hypothetical protein GXO69_09620 [Acidobacteria bacterium]|nr:hypothetical protein [Acidobacteriota bacterium]
MKKLLTTIFMAVLTVSVFATVNVETETPSVNHDGACERVGSMRFIVTNDQDYQSASTTTPITVKIELTDAAVLCHDLDGTDDANNYWVELEVDGTAGTSALPMWQPGQVLARGARGSNYIEVIIRSNPHNGTTLPNPTNQAWFRLGSTVLIDGNAFTPTLYDDNFQTVGTKTQGVPVCVNYTAHPNGVDQFPQNAFNVISLTTWDGGINGTQLGVSYSPANPAIAYGGTGSTHNFVVDHHYDKCSLSTDDVLLCQCYVYTEGQSQASGTYDCHDLYRLGTLDLYNQISDQDGDGNPEICRVYLTEDEAGMLPQDSVITMTIVDAAGNPLSTLSATDGVYINSASLTVNGTPATTLTLNQNPGTPGAPVDLTTNTPEYSNLNNANGFIPADGVCDTSGKDACVDNYDLYESMSWTVTNPSTTHAAQINVGDVTMGRYTAAGPVTAYVKISWSPFPCGTGNSVILTDYPLNFVACPDEATQPVVYYPSYEYFTYFPALNGQWWAGLAVTNVTYFNETFAGGFPGVTDQDADVTLYLIEQDGDVYTANVGTLPKSGILVTLLSDPSFSPTPVTKSDTTFGDEPFWVVAKATPTIANTWISIDGFGMLGDGNQGQGTLPRIDQPGWFFGAPLFQK